MNIQAEETHKDSDEREDVKEDPQGHAQPPTQQNEVHVDATHDVGDKPNRPVVDWADLALYRVAACIVILPFIWSNALRLNEYFAVDEVPNVGSFRMDTHRFASNILPYTNMRRGDNKDEPIAPFVSRDAAELSMDCEHSSAVSVPGTPIVDYCQRVRTHSGGIHMRRATAKMQSMYAWNLALREALYPGRDAANLEHIGWRLNLADLGRQGVRVFASEAVDAPFDRVTNRTRVKMHQFTLFINGDTPLPVLDSMEQTGGCSAGYEESRKSGVPLARKYHVMGTTKYLRYRAPSYSVCVEFSPMNGIIRIETDYSRARDPSRSMSEGVDVAVMSYNDTVRATIDEVTRSFDKSDLSFANIIAITCMAGLRSASGCMIN